MCFDIIETTDTAIIVDHLVAELFFCIVIGNNNVILYYYLETKCMFSTITKFNTVKK